MRIKLRRWTRALHRDLGYLSVGLTFVYAVSGLAVNHIADWEPNQRTLSGELDLGELPLGEQGTQDPQAIAMLATSTLLGEGNSFEADTLYTDETWIEFRSQNTRFQVERSTGHLHWERDEPRFFVKTANWLHLNRGKKAWTYIADGYAIALLLLASTGLWMIPGKKGVWGRGLVWVLLGVTIPVAYVHCSESPTQMESNS